MSATNPVIPDVKVSVCMITYNHERFIAQAIESVLMQETDFRVELVIGEDCSTDGTRAIVIEYAQRYPDRIRPLLPDHNLGMIPNFVATIQACGGQYIALLEGDDYWTDPCKLQKQVEFLETHPECALSFHNVMIHNQESKENPCPRYPAGQKAIWLLEDIVYQNPISTCSVVFRNGLIVELPPWYLTMTMGDWPLWVLLTQYGTAGYMDEVMATYRIHSGGVFTGRVTADWIVAGMKAYDTFDQVLNHEYHDIIRKGKANFLNDMALGFLVEAADSIPPKDAVLTFWHLWTQHSEVPIVPR